MAVEPRDVVLDDVREFVDRSFRPMADQKHLDFEVELGPGAPERIFTDPQRLQQVLKNLVSNAVKFTEKGFVSLVVSQVEPAVTFTERRLMEAEEVVAFVVTDTGIGIRREAEIIFEAFQQADGTTSRKYGGTGLGLSSVESLPRLLGGEIAVESTVGKGSTSPSTFPPGMCPSSSTGRRMRRPEAAPIFPRVARAVCSRSLDDGAVSVSFVEDDRDRILPGDRVVLIIEDDVKFVPIMVSLAREHGFKAVVALRGIPGSRSPISSSRTRSPSTCTCRVPTDDGFSIG